MVRNVSLKGKTKGAVWYYHHPDYGYNCAQAIVKYFGGENHEIEEMADYGSGKAPQGYCGALHAGLHILSKNSMETKKLIQEFSEQTGSAYCPEIRIKREASCRQCVEITGKLLSLIFSNKSLL